MATWHKLWYSPFFRRCGHPIEHNPHCQENCSFQTSLVVPAVTWRLPSEHTGACPLPAQALPPSGVFGDLWFRTDTVWDWDTIYWKLPESAKGLRIFATALKILGRGMSSNLELDFYCWKVIHGRKDYSYIAGMVRAKWIFLGWHGSG